jgi:hypothetical protein
VALFEKIVALFEKIEPTFEKIVAFFFKKRHFLENAPALVSHLPFSAPLATALLQRPIRENAETDY